MQNDRARLVELINHHTSREYMDGDNDRLADHILEDGWIRLPCKIGETLYLIQIDFKGNYSISECLVGSKITMLSIMRAHEEQTVVYMSINKQEAEQKLKELKGNK